MNYSEMIGKQAREMDDPQKEMSMEASILRKAVARYVKAKANKEKARIDWNNEAERKWGEAETKAYKDMLEIITIQENL